MFVGDFENQLQDLLPSGPPMEVLAESTAEDLHAKMDYSQLAHLARLFCNDVEMILESIPLPSDTGIHHSGNATEARLEVMDYDNCSIAKYHPPQHSVLLPPSTPEIT